MDTRHIWGDESIYRTTCDHAGAAIPRHRRAGPVPKIEGEIRKSSEKFGHTIYLLEPNLKEGPGSLRYIQLIVWLVRMIFGCQGLDDLPTAGICGRRAVEDAKTGMNFLAEVRTRLHSIADRRDDRLNSTPRISWPHKWDSRILPNAAVSKVLCVSTIDMRPPWIFLLVVLARALFWKA